MNLLADVELRDDSAAQLQDLQALCEQAVALCRRLGADQAEAAVRSSSGLEVGVRLGEVETLTRTRGRTLTVTAWFGSRKGVASTGDFGNDSLRLTADTACAIARRTEPDPYTGLADPQLRPREVHDLDLWHPWALDARQAIELALQAEAAGRGHDARIVNSEGAAVETAAILSARADSAGFVGGERRTRHELSAAFIARDAHGMHGGSWYDTACASADLADPGAVGRRAAERTVARLDGRRLGTRQCPVLFAADMAAGLLGHLVAAAQGSAVAQGASFLAGQLQQRVLPDFVDLRECPHLRRGPGSRNQDAEGVATTTSPLVAAGRLQRYVLDSHSARRLGLASTGNAGGISNLEVSHGDDDLQALLRRMDSGLLVTRVMGQGVSLVSGDYSRGVAGFWVEHGRIAYPVEGITIASNLKDMYAGIVAVGSDVDRRLRIRTGSILVERMTVAGA